MNVAGINAPTAPQVVPAVSRVQPTEQAKMHPQQHREAENQAGPQAQPRRAAPEPPKFKPLSTVEVQVMLGMAPAEVLLEREPKPGKNAFDAYA